MSSAPEEFVNAPASPDSNKPREDNGLEPPDLMFLTDLFQIGLFWIVVGAICYGVAEYKEHTSKRIPDWVDFLKALSWVWVVGLCMYLSGKFGLGGKDRPRAWTFSTIFIGLALPAHALPIYFVWNCLDLRDQGHYAVKGGNACCSGFVISLFVLPHLYFCLKKWVELCEPRMAMHFLPEPKKKEPEKRL